jgi:hypothetical protein
MPEPARPPDIAAEDWAATPAAVRKLVQDQQRRLDEQEARLTTLEARLAALEERLKQTSRTSSRPPSSDPPQAPPRRQRARSGRPAGGQVGHAGHGRPLLPVEQGDPIVEVKPEVCAPCGAPLAGDDPAPGRHQVAELPRILRAVTE